MEKRIDILIGSLRGGGAERVCVTVANGFAECGFDVRLIALNLHAAVYQKDLNKKIDLVNLHKKHARESLFALGKYIKQKHPQKILVFDYQLAVLLLFLRFLLGKHYTVVARNINTLSIKRDNEASFWHRHIVHRVVKPLYKRVNRVVAQSEGMAKNLIKHYSFDPEKIIIIHNPVAQPIEQSAKNCKLLSSKTKESKEILFVGRLDLQKGVNFLIDAFSLCIKRMPDIKLHILGTGPLKKQLQSQVARFGLDEKVIFHGFTNNVIPYYQNADVTVLSSLYEGFPNVLVESITLGTPVVSFDCPSGPSEIIIEDVNGFLVEYQNINKLADAVSAALLRDWDAIAIQETAKKFSTDRIINQYISVIESC
ncbi:N-acetylgalactosamine-N,N'-diacetylbacillosaminyl-diphospho-undecaprenol 4-alpha-N-acetylgalactosaminyltransferase [subsurface metagenome]